MLIVASYPNCQGYTIETTGASDRKGVEVSGLWMVAEKWEEKEVPGGMIIRPSEFFSGNSS